MKKARKPNTNRAPITLRRETIAVLSPPELGRVAGGKVLSESDPCSWDDWECTSQPIFN